MRLTHHTSPTRSFLIILIVVFATVYAALMLIHIQWKMEQIAEIRKSLSMPKSSIDTSSWQQYLDKNYPLNLLIPPTWKANAESLENNYYVLHLDPPGKSGAVNVYISDKGFAGITNPSGPTFYNNSKSLVTEYEDGIFLMKEGEYYYTFDALTALDYRKELREIIRLARFK